MRRRRDAGTAETAAGISYSPYSPERVAGRWWWVLLVNGILWIVIGLYVLQSHVDSAVVVGYLVAVWLLFAGVAEFVELGMAVGWRWLHVVLGILFIAGGILSLFSPFQTFMVLASFMGFFLIVKGTFDFALALASRHEVDLWWMTLIAGILQLVLGIWAMGYPGRSAALLLVWVGVGAIIRGVAEIVMAFRINTLQPEAVAA